MPRLTGGGGGLDDAQPQHELAVLDGEVEAEARSQRRGEVGGGGGARGPGRVGLDERRALEQRGGLGQRLGQQAQLGGEERRVARLRRRRRRQRQRRCAGRRVRVRQRQGQHVDGLREQRVQAREGRHVDGVLGVERQELVRECAKLEEDGLSVGEKQKTKSPMLVKDEELGGEGQAGLTPLTMRVPIRVT